MGALSIWTDDRTLGAQRLSFFNSYYDSWCYPPLLAFLTFDRQGGAAVSAAPDGLAGRSSFSG